MRFFAAALATTLCMIIALAVAMPRERWAELAQRDWLLGLLIIGTTSGLVGLISLLGSRNRRRGRIQSRDPFDPTDVIPFI